MTSLLKDRYDSMSKLCFPLAVPGKKSTNMFTLTKGVSRGNSVTPPHTHIHTRPFQYLHKVDGEHCMHCNHAMKGALVCLGLFLHRSRHHIWDSCCFSLGVAFISLPFLVHRRGKRLLVIFVFFRNDDSERTSVER